MKSFAKRLARPFVTIFDKIAEPRVIRVSQALVYLSLVVGGIAAILFPPVGFIAAIGVAGCIAFGLFLLVGGLLAAAGVLAGKRFWWLERSGISGLTVGLVIRGILILALGISLTVAMIYVALLIEFLVYYLFIRKSPLIPAWR